MGTAKLEKLTTAKNNILFFNYKKANG